MKPFLHDDFLLQSDLAGRLYHEVAKDLPVVDYHNHLHPASLAANRPFENLARLWLTDDQYKHRAMRINGIPERYITGEASDREKFQCWAQTTPKTIGNPLFHWTALELKRFFGIDELLNDQTAEAIWQTCNAQLTQEEFRRIALLKKLNIELLCTSDDLLDDLEPHQKVSTPELQVLPSLRGDSMTAFGKAGFPDWLQLLSEQTGLSIRSLETYKEALIKRIDVFQCAGCRLADHALNAGFSFSLPDEASAAHLFHKRLAGELLSAAEHIQLKSHLLVFLGEEYARRGWALQLHIGAQRQTSSRLLHLAGIAGGYAAIGQPLDPASLCQYLDALERKGSLPNIILFNLNPADNEVLASLTGSFSEDGVVGKIQFGPAWWYNDHYDGIRKQLITLANYGLLSRFIGMTTDSRSILSFSRQEYFRRILCNLIGEWVKDGHVPADFELLSTLVQDISYYNSKHWITQKKALYEPKIAKG